MTGSVSSWLAALDEQPGDAGVFDDAVAALVRAEDWRALLDIGERHGAAGDGRWAQVADALEVVAGQSLEPSDRSELLLSIGDVWRHRLGHPEHALQHYQGALRVKRDNVAAIERAREVHREQGTWAMVQRLYQLELRIVRSDEDRARLLTEAGLVQRDGLDDALGAQDYFERALAACQDFAPAIEALEGSQEPGEADVYARCQADLEAAQGDERVALLVRSAELLLEMGDAAPADPVEALTAARALDPNSVSAMQAMAVVLRRRGATGPLRELLEALGRSAAAADVRLSAALELHAIWRAEGDEASARATLEEALALDAGGAEVVEAARAWYAGRGQAERLASILEEAIRRRRGGAQELEWHRELGRLWADELGDLARAETHYRRVAMMDGEDDAMLRFYVRLYASRGDQKKRIGKLRELRDLSRTDAERFEWSWEMAEVAVDALEDPVRAVDVWSWYVKRVPDDPRGRQSLRRMLHAAGRWTRLAEFLKGELERLPEDDLDGRVAVHVELAGIYGEHVDLPMLEVQAYQNVLALAPAHTGAVDAVVARWEASQRWLDAAEQLDSAAGSTADVDDLDRWSRRAADLWATHMSDDARSAESLLRVANAGRGDAELLASLEQLLGASGQEARRIDILRLRAAGSDSAERERLLREALEETPEQSARLGLLEDLVAVTEKRDRAAVLELGGLLDAAGESARALALVEAFVAQLESPTADDLRELGGRSLDAGQFDAAARYYERSLTAEPGDDQAIAGLLQALLDAERWADVRAAALRHGAWERAADALVETGERVDDVERFMDAGALALEGGQDPARAIDLYGRALEARPGDPEVAKVLAVAYAEAGDATGRADMLELLAERASGRERARLQLELASLYEGALGAPSEGLTWRLAALEVDPTDPDARADAQQRAREHERLSEWATVVRQGAAVMPAGAARLAVYRELAVVFGDELGNIDNAIDFHQRVLVEVPDDRESLDALADLLVRAERWVDAEPVLEARVASAADEASREVAEARLFAHRIEHLDSCALGDGVHFTSNEALGLVRAALERKELWAAASDLARRQAERAEDPVSRFDALASALELDVQGAGLNESILERAASLLSEAPEPARAGTLAKRVMDHESALGFGERVADIVEPALRAAERWDDVVALLHDRIRQRDTEGALPLMRELIRVETELRGDTRSAARLWVGWIARGPMSEGDVREADAASAALGARDGFLVAWSRRLADATLRDDVVAWAELPDIVLPREALDARVRDSEGTDARTLTHWINALREGWQASGEGERYLSLARDLIDGGQAGTSVEARLHAELARAEMQSDPGSAWSHVHDALRGGVMDEALLDVFEVVRTHGAPEDSAAALEEGLSVSRSVETQARVHALLGEAYRHELSQPEEAIRHYEAAVFVCGDPAAPLRVLAELYGETGDDESRVAVLERLADLEPDRRGALLLEASAATDPSTGRAIELAESARAAGELGAVDVLRRLYRDAERWDGLAELLLELSEDAPDEEASALLSERAEVLEEHLLRPRAAAETWEAIRIRAPKDTGVLRRLERLYTNLADTGARIAVLEAQLESETEDTVDVRRRLAQARVEAEEFSAAGEIAEELLTEKRDDPVALDVLEQVVERTDDPAAAEALFASYADVERWQDASRLARGVASRATELESALSWLERARDVEARSLGDPHAAFALTLEIFRRSSGERPELRAVRDAAERVDGWRSLAATVEDLAEQRKDIGLATFLASIYAEKLANLERAGRWVDHALAIDPDHVPALWLRTGLDAEAPLQIAHVKPLRRLARRVEAARRVEVLTRLAAVHRALRQTSDELAVIAELEEMSPTAEVVKRHDALLKANGAFEAVVRRWERRASQSDGLDAESLWLQAAVLRRKSLSDAEGALGNLRHLAAIAPASVELEVELDAFVHDAAASRDARDQAIRLRLDALRRAEDPARLRDALERSIAHASEDDRALLRVELAELLEGNDEHDAAFAVWLSALRERPSSKAILEALWRHAERSWRWGAFVEALRDVAASSEELALLRKVAEIEEGPLQDPESALMTWRQVAQRERRAEDEEQVRRLLLVLQDWDGVIRWHRARAERSDDPELVRASLVRIAALEVAERADVGAAMNALELLVEREPAEARWTLALVELAERAGQWNRATAALEAAVAATADEAVRSRWLHRLAILERDARGDATRAAAVFEQLLETRPDDVALWEQLESTYRASESWPALTAALERRAEVLGDNDALSRAALLTGRELASPREALALAARVSKPSAELRDAMFSWLPHAEAPDYLARQLVASSSSDERGAALRAALGAISDADLRADYALELATLAHAEDRLDDALVLLLDELDAGATRDDVWEQIVDLCDDAGRVERAAERVLLSTFDYGDPAREARVALAIGGLASDERELADLAEPLFLRALEIDPSSEDALDGLEGLYVAQGRGAALLRVLTRAAEASGALRRAELYARVAAIAETRLNNPERALAAWAAVLEVAPDDTTALREVARIAATVERWAEAIDAMQRLADAAAEPGERASWLAEAAAVVVENQEHPHGAVALLDEASELAPDDAGLVDRLIEVLLQLERPNAAVEALEERAARVEGAPERAARYWARAAELRVDALDDPDGAIEAAKNALEADPSDDREDTLIALLRRAQRIRELIDQLENLLERAGVDVIAVHLEIASLAATALGDRERAGRHLEAARVLEPSRIDVRVAFAEALRLEGDLDAALAEFDSAMESAQPADRALLLSEKGRVARSAGLHEEAAGWTEEAFALDPSQDEIYARLCSGFAPRGAWSELRDVLLRRASEAEGRASAEMWRRLATLAAGSLNEEPLIRSSLERSLAADPDNSETANWLLRIYIDRGEIDEALPLLEQLTSRAERDGSRGDLHRLYFMQGRIEELREQPEQACVAYERSFRADATYVPNLLALGRLYLEAERFEDALRVLQAALLYQRTIRSQPRRAELFFLLGSVRSARGDRARAVEMFQRALATLPEHEGARAALDALEES